MTTEFSRRVDAANYDAFRQELFKDVRALAAARGERAESAARKRFIRKHLIRYNVRSYCAGTESEQCATLLADLQRVRADSDGDVGPELKREPASPFPMSTSPMGFPHPGPQGPLSSTGLLAAQLVIWLCPSTDVPFTAFLKKLGRDSKTVVVVKCKYSLLLSSKWLQTRDQIWCTAPQ